MQVAVGLHISVKLSGPTWTELAQRQVGKLLIEHSVSLAAMGRGQAALAVLGCTPVLDTMCWSVLLCCTGNYR